MSLSNKHVVYLKLIHNTVCQVYLSNIGGKWTKELNVYFSKEDMQVAESRMPPISQEFISSPGITEMHQACSMISLTLRGGMCTGVQGEEAWMQEA